MHKTSTALALSLPGLFPFSAPGAVCPAFVIAAARWGLLSATSRPVPTQLRLTCTPLLFLVPRSSFLAWSK